MVNIFIDQLTNSIIKLETGEIFETTLIEISKSELSNLKGWLFDWMKESVKCKIFKLTIKDYEEIQGLISLEIRRGFVFVSLVENAPFNIGSKQIYKGVGGNLFAFACKVSLENNFDGYVSFIAKTELIEHYQNSLGAKLVSNQSMVIDENAAQKLLEKYFKK